MTTGMLDASLDKCPLFRGMTASERQELLGMLELQSYHPGQAIQSEGESFQYLWVVLKGKCRIVKKIRSGEERELTVLDAYGVFGEMSFFNPAPHSASVHALTEVELARLSREKYDILMRVGSTAACKLAFNTIAVLIDRVRRMDDWIADHLESNSAPEHREEWKDFQSKLYTGWTF
ncbi:MAG: cyclic nucleotide-binding domain-containing protein [Planctomycetia bacterium]|nr:cyclic nucleotide-binding domain-containing protein [Planctomycetia bacterium]